MTKKKTPAEKSKTKMGRPVKLEQEECRANLLAAASFDMNTEAMCAYAGIDTATYYRYIEKHPDFLSEVQRKRMIPYHRAVQKVVKSIEHDPKMALAYLERRFKKEFSPRTELTGADGSPFVGGLAGIVSQAEKVLEDNGESVE